MVEARVGVGVHCARDVFVSVVSPLKMGARYSHEVRWVSALRCLLRRSYMEDGGIIH